MFFFFIFFLNIFGPMPLFLFFNTQTMHISSKAYKCIAMFMQTLMGFEPGPAGGWYVHCATTPRQKLFLYS
jgi:hypothetical protein